jgi:hypothetical protein
MTHEDEQILARRQMNYPQYEIYQSMMNAGLIGHIVGCMIIIGVLAVWYFQ